MSKSKQTTTYPTKEQYERWSEKAEENGMSMSEWIECMVEAGQKKFEAGIEPDESHRELREQRYELGKLAKERQERINELEDRLYQDERAAVIEFLEENPGSDFGDIMQHLIDTAGDRAMRYLDEMSGDEIMVENDLYYVKDGGDC